jgi:hypothetical protein
MKNRLSESPTGTAADGVHLLADFTDELLAVGCVSRGWPRREFDSVRERALQLCGNPPPPAKLAKGVTLALEVIRGVFGEPAASEMSGALTEVASQPEALLAMQCYAFALGFAIASKLAAQAAAAPLN